MMIFLILSSALSEAEVLFPFLLWKISNIKKSNIQESTMKILIPLHGFCEQHVVVFAVLHLFIHPFTWMEFLSISRYKRRLTVDLRAFGQCRGKLEHVYESCKKMVYYRKSDLKIIIVQVTWQ